MRISFLSVLYLTTLAVSVHAQSSPGTVGLNPSSRGGTSSDASLMPEKNQSERLAWAPNKNLWRPEELLPWFNESQMKLAKQPNYSQMIQKLKPARAIYFIDFVDHKTETIGIMFSSGSNDLDHEFIDLIRKAEIKEPPTNLTKKKKFKIKFNGDVSKAPDVEVSVYAPGTKQL